ncbi:hypothetical protein SA14R_06725, partial [Rothia kristinae]
MGASPGPQGGAHLEHPEDRGDGGHRDRRDRRRGRGRLRAVLRRGLLQLPGPGRTRRHGRRDGWRPGGRHRPGGRGPVGRRLRRRGSVRA